MTSLNFSITSRKFKHITLAVLGVACSATVLAQDVPGWYIGANAGRGKASNFDNSPITNSLNSQGFTVNSTTEDNRDNSYKIFGGYQLNRNFALEGGYFDLGKFTYGFATTPAGSLNGESRIRGLNLDLVGLLPMTDKFSVFGRVGANYARTTANFNNTGAVPGSTLSSRHNDTNWKAGLGLQYAFTPALALRAELERYRINDPLRSRGHVDVATLGLVYRFGGKEQTRVAQAYTPPAAVAPAPAVTPAPYTPAPSREAPVAAPPPPMAMPAPAPEQTYVPPARAPKQGRN